MDNLKLPPQSIEAERAILSAILLGDDVIDRVSNIMTSDDFYREIHRIIYETATCLISEGITPDIVSIQGKMRESAGRKFEGTAVVLHDLLDQAFTTVNAEHYARVLNSKATLRRYISVQRELLEEAYSDPEDIDIFMDKAEAASMAVRSTKGDRSIEHASLPMAKVMKQMEYLCKHQGECTGVRTGFADLDKLTFGLQASDLVLLAARPSMGKTALALNIAEFASKPTATDGAVLFFSLEMSKEQLCARIMSSGAQIDSHRMRSGHLIDRDFGDMFSVADSIKSGHLFIDDSAGISPLEIRARARRLKREHGLSLIVVDYVQLMGGSGDKPREQEVSGYSRALKATAKDLEVPVLALSQLNRSLEGRSNKRPILSDLRESGALEQDADVVLFLYRDEVYDQKSVDRGVAEVIIAKHRNGPVGTVKLQWSGEHTQFRNLAKNVGATGW